MIEIGDQQPNIMIDRNIDSGVFVPYMNDYIDIFIVANVFLEEYASKVGCLFPRVPIDAS